MSSWRKLFFSSPFPHRHKSRRPPGKYETRMAAHNDARSWESYRKIGDYMIGLSCGSILVRVSQWNYSCPSISCGLCLWLSEYLLPGGSAEFIRPNCTWKCTSCVPYRFSTIQSYAKTSIYLSLSQRYHRKIRLFIQSLIPKRMYVFTVHNRLFFRKIVGIERLPVQQHWKAAFYFKSTDCQPVQRSVPVKTI